MKHYDTIDVYIDNDNPAYRQVGLVLNGEIVKAPFDGLLFIAGNGIKKLRMEILTCSCGVAGCAGIFEGTIVKTRRYSVEWRDIDCGLPKRFYSFGRHEYNEAVQKALNLFVEIIETREYTDDEEYYNSAIMCDDYEDMQRYLAYMRERMIRFNEFK